MDRILMSVDKYISTTSLVILINSFDTCAIQRLVLCTFLLWMIWL